MDFKLTRRLAGGGAAAVLIVIFDNSAGPPLHGTDTSMRLIEGAIVAICGACAGAIIGFLIDAVRGNRKKDRQVVPLPLHPSPSIAPTLLLAGTHDIQVLAPRLALPPLLQTPFLPEPHQENRSPDPAQLPLSRERVSKAEPRNAATGEAMNNLGMCHANGEGVPKDNVLAYMWLNLAAATGDASAAQARESVAAQMTREEIAEAQRMCREWKPEPSCPNPVLPSAAPRLLVKTQLNQMKWNVEEPQQSANEGFFGLFVSISSVFGLLILLYLIYMNSDAGKQPDAQAPATGVSSPLPNAGVNTTLPSLPRTFHSVRWR